MSQFLIYGLVDPTTDQFRYIGRSSSGLERAKQHIYPSRLQADKTYKAHWLRKLLSSGAFPSIAVLEKVASADDLNTAEKRWIDYGRRHGWPLTNLTEGGEGLCGLVFSAEHRAKISAANRGRKMTAEQVAKLRASKSLPQCMAAARENIKKAQASRVGCKRSEEFKRLVSSVHKGKVTSAYVKQKVAEANSTPVEEVTTGARFPSAAEAARRLGLCYRSVVKVLNSRASHTRGFTFRRIQA